MTNSAATIACGYCFPVNNEWDTDWLLSLCFNYESMQRLLSAGERDVELAEENEWKFAVLESSVIVEKHNFEFVCEERVFPKVLQSNSMNLLVSPSDSCRCQFFIEKLTVTLESDNKLLFLG